MRRPASTRPLLVSGQPDVIEAVLDRLPAPAHPDVAAEVDAARQRYATAPRVLVGADLLSALAAAGPGRRPDVALLLPVGAADPDPRACIGLGVEQVLDLDDGAQWLASAETSAGHTVAVTGARGGCGVSTLAAALAVSAAADGCEVLLVDLDPVGGGLDVLLGADHLIGARWPDLAPDQVDRLADLPRLGNLTVLSAGREPVQLAPEYVRAVLRRAVEAFDLVVLDLPRSAPESLLPESAVVLLVVPDEIRAGTAAAVRLAGLSAFDVRIVVRESVGGEPALETADRLGRPLAGRLRTENRLTEEAERGLTRPARTRSPLWRLAGRLIADLVPELG